MLKDDKIHIEKLENKVQMLSSENQYLKDKLDWLQRQVFGQKSEKTNSDTSQTDLFEEEIVKPETDEVVKIAEHTKKKRSKDQERKPFSDKLQRKEIHHRLSDEDRQCPCGCTLKEIGCDVKEVLEYIPQSCYVAKHYRYKYACCNEAENGIVTPFVAKPAISARVGTSVIAYILTSKYSDHLPLERIENIFNRQNVHMPKSTMVGYVEKAYQHLIPLYDRMREEILDSDIVNVDETRINVQLKSKKDKCHQGWYWAYIGDKKHLCFQYSHGRGGNVPVEFLNDFQGEYLQADDYAGYNQIIRDYDLKRVGCWAHTRRKFYDLAKAGSKIAETALEMIGELYKIEKDIKEKNLLDSDKLNYRERHSIPQLKKIEEWLNDTRNNFQPIPKKLSDALNYASSNFEYLREYVNDAELNIDNNIVERAIRQVAVGRKNWLFAGSEEGAKRSAVMFSLIGSCKLCGVEPLAYLTDIIERLKIHPKEKLGELLPYHWKNKFESQV